MASCTLAILSSSGSVSLNRSTWPFIPEMYSYSEALAPLPVVTFICGHRGTVGVDAA
jgi:hypothetical protein